VVLLVFGLWWCIDIFLRLPKDIAELRENSDALDKGLIVFYWILTLGIVWMIYSIVYGLVTRILQYL